REFGESGLQRLPALHQLEELGQEEDQAGEAQATAAPATAEGGSSLCRGGEWRWRPRGMA
ncbi:hypothetical protein, partial [Streptomyces sp. NPDC001919]